MLSQSQLITDFYTAFQTKDYRTMQSLYSSDATFNDPVFQNLNAEEAKAMWEMLCKRGKDLEITFENVQADKYNGSVDWQATYTLSATGRKIVNRIHSEFVFENGKIVQHVDDFHFHKWAKQAFGMKGFLIGWTPFFRDKVRSFARKNLEKMMLEK